MTNRGLKKPNQLCQLQSVDYLLCLTQKLNNKKYIIKTIKTFTQTLSSSAKTF